MKRLLQLYSIAFRALVGRICFLSIIPFLTVCLCLCVYLCVCVYVCMCACCSAAVSQVFRPEVEIEIKASTKKVFLMENELPEAAAVADASHDD